jgi:hypothetical protein
MPDEVTSVRVRQSTKERLRTFEVHHRETDEEIIQRLMDKAEGKK